VLDHDVSVLKPRRNAEIMVLPLVVWWMVIGSIVAQCHSFCQFIPHPTRFQMPDQNVQNVTYLLFPHYLQKSPTWTEVQYKSKAAHCTLICTTSFMPFMVQIYSFELGFQRHFIFLYQAKKPWSTTGAACLQPYKALSLSLSVSIML
jgi:hypothetical protein